MATLKFVGGSSNQSNEVMIRSQIQNLLAGNINQAAVDSQITTRLSPYATKAYVDTQDAKLADSAFIDAADNTRLDKNNLNKPGYPFTLDKDGKIPADKIKVTNLQKYPNTAVATSGGGGTTTSETFLLNLSVPDPGYPYKLLVTGTVSASVSTDTGARPQVIVFRGDNVAVAQGYGISESYQTPAVGSVSSKMYVAAPYAPPAWPNVVITKPGDLLNSSIAYNSGWQNMSWVPVNTDPYFTSLSGTTYMQATANMSNVSMSASVSFANGFIPNDALFDNVGKLVAEMQIYSSRSGTIATSAPSNGRVVSGTLTASVSNLTVNKGDLFTVQVKQSMYCPWGTLGLGTFATWAPVGSGVSNTLTMVPGLAAGSSGGEISILPLALSNQSVISGPTTLSVRLQSSGGVAVTALVAPSPRIMAIPIPA